MKTGIERIADERQRQIDVEGWTPAHDDNHDRDELAYAAVSYAAPMQVYTQVALQGGPAFFDTWPNQWASSWDKRPYDEDGEERLYGEGVSMDERLRCLEKAGALIAAEIDRLIRKQLEDVTHD